MDTRAQPFRVIGRRTPKVDAIDKVTGRAQFGADVPLSRLLVGQVLRAHTRMRVSDALITSQAAALANAIYRATGVRRRELPMTPERLYRAVQGADSSSAAACECNRDC